MLFASSNFLNCSSREFVNLTFLSSHFSISSRLPPWTSKLPNSISSEIKKNLANINFLNLTDASGVYFNPNKVLKKLIGKTVISHIINRCNQIDGVRLVCCAIPDDQSNDVLAQEIKKTKAELYRGSEIDVLNRYFMAAKYFDAKNKYI